MVNSVGNHQPMHHMRGSEARNRGDKSEESRSERQPGRAEYRENRENSQSNEDLNTPSGGLDARNQFDVTQGLRHRRFDRENQSQDREGDAEGSGTGRAGGCGRRARNTGNTGNTGTDGATDSNNNDGNDANNNVNNVATASFAATGSGTAQSGGSGKPSTSGEQSLDQWDAQIEAAAMSTGLPANFIKATLWAESRGNPNDPSQNPDGQHTDEGVMQISDYTYGDVMANQPNAPRGLVAGNPTDNIMMGAWELKDKLEKAGGDYVKTSMAYVGTGDAHEQEYANWVQTYWQELDAGQKLSDF